MTDRIDAKRAELLQRRAVIDAQLALLDELAGEPPAAAPAPPAAPKARRGPPPPTAGESRQPGGVFEAARARRLLVARLIADKGPQRHADVHRELGIPTGSLTSVLGHAWFEKTDAGFALTDAGRAALAESARGPGE